MIEFALSFSLIFLVFTGAYQFGYAFLAYNTLQTAVRAGARYAATRTYDSATCTPSTAFQAAVKNVTVYGTPNPPSGTAPVFPDLTTAKVDVYVGSCAGGVPQRISVSIKDFTVSSGFTFTLRNKPYATFVYEGTYAPL